MVPYKKILTNIICTLQIILGSAALPAQSTQGVPGENYVFTVQTIVPMRGSARQETSGDYTLRVTPDSVISYLPYFGRAYSATIGTTDLAFQFNSTNFDYRVANRKKGGWDIVIKPKDVGEQPQLALTIFPGGTASLQVTSANRDPITFNGTVESKKK